jgi:hypothetical protein
VVAVTTDRDELLTTAPAAKAAGVSRMTLARYVDKR